MRTNIDRPLSAIRRPNCKGQICFRSAHEVLHVVVHAPHRHHFGDVDLRFPVGRHPVRCEVRLDQVDNSVRQALGEVDRELADRIYLMEGGFSLGPGAIGMGLGRNGVMRPLLRAVL